MKLLCARGKSTRQLSLVAAVSSVLFTFGSTRAASTPASWLTETSGTWSNPALWSTNPNYPNNGVPSGAAYDASINAIGGTAYSVALDSDVTVNSLTLDSSDATLTQTAGTFTALTTTLSAGTFTLNGGTINNGMWTLNGGVFNANSGSINSLRINLTGSNSTGPSTFTLGSGIILYGSADVKDGAFSGSTVINNGTISNGIVNNLTVINPLRIETTNFTNNGLIKVGKQSSIFITDSNFTNNGMIQAVNIGQVQLSATNWSNSASGTISADKSSITLGDYGNSWSNAGTISAANGSALAFGGNFTTAAIGSLSISADSTVSLNLSANLDNAGATLNPSSYGGTWISYATINNGTLDVSGGKFSCAAGALSGVTVIGGDLQLNGGLLNISGVNITGGDLRVNNGTLDIVSGLVINDHHLDLSTQDSGRTVVYLDGPSHSVDNLDINSTDTNNDVSIQIGGPNSVAPPTVTLSSTAVIHGSATVKDYFNAGNIDATLINNGTINADISKKQLAVMPSHFTNNNVAEATNGGTLQIAAPNWVNAPGGVISASGSTLSLYGSWVNQGSVNVTNGSTLNLRGVTTAGIGSLTVSADSQVYFGNIDNTGATFNPINYGGTWYSMGTLTNGILDVSSGKFNAYQGTLVGVTVIGGDLVVGNGATLGARDTIVTAGDVTVNGGTLTMQNLTVNSHNVNLVNGSIDIGGTTQTVDNLNFNCTPGGAIVVFANQISSPITLTLGANVLIHGGATISDNQKVNTLINDGTINANVKSVSITVSPSHFTNNNLLESSNNGILQIDSGNWNNALGGNITASGGTLNLRGGWNNLGTISATNISTLGLGGTFTTANIGALSVSADSAVFINGVLDNSGATLVPSSYGGGWSLQGTITAGSIDLTGKHFSVQSGTLSGVTVVGGDLRVINGSLDILKGVTVTNHNLTLTNSLLFWDGPSQSVDNLNINAIHVAIAACAVFVGGPKSTGPTTLTLGANAIIHGSADIKQQNAGSTLINNGVISSDSSGQTMTINTTNFTNNNLLQAINGATLSITSPNFTNNGTIALTGGTINAPIGLNVGDGTLSGSGTIVGNVTLDSDPSTLAFGLRGSGDYDSLTINGNMTLAGYLQLTLAGGFMPAGSDVFTVLDVQSPFGLTGSFLNVADGQTLETSDGAGYFTVDYADSSFPNEIVLSDFHSGAVPEPASLSMLLGAGCLMIRRRRAQ